MATKAKAKKTAPVIVPVKVLAYNTTAQGFEEWELQLPKDQPAVPSDMDDGLLLVRDAATHAVLCNAANSGYAIIRGSDGYAAIGEMLEEKMPPGLFLTAAMGSRAIQLRALGYHSLGDAVALADPEVATKIRLWAIAFNAKMDEVNAMVQAGTMTANRALAELPAYEG